MPFLLEEVANDSAGWFRGEIVTEKTAVIIIFSGRHVALFRKSGKTVDKVPVQNAAHCGMTEPDGVESPDDLRLNFFIFRGTGIGGNGQFGNVDRFAQIRIGVQYIIDALRVVTGTVFTEFIFPFCKHVELHADFVDAAAFEKRVFDLHEVRTSGSKEVVIPDAAVRFVDDQTVRGKTALRFLKTPFYKIRLVVKVCWVEPGCPEGFICDFPHWNAVGVTGGEFLKTFSQTLFFPFDRAACPGRSETCVIQTVRFRLDTVRFAVFQTQINCGTAVDVRTVFGKTWPSLFRFEIGPVERECRNVKEGGKHFPVGFVLFRRAELIQHEKICAVFEIVRFLTEADMNSGQRRAFVLRRVVLKIEKK